MTMMMKSLILITDCICVNQELIHAHQPQSVYSTVMIEKRLMGVACKEWDTSDKLDSNFNQQAQKDVSTKSEMRVLTALLGEDVDSFNMSSFVIMRCLRGLNGCGRF